MTIKYLVDITYPIKNHPRYDALIKKKVKKSPDWKYKQWGLRELCFYNLTREEAEELVLTLNTIEGVDSMYYEQNFEG